MYKINIIINLKSLGNQTFFFFFTFLREYGKYLITLSTLCDIATLIGISSKADNGMKPSPNTGFGLVKLRVNGAIQYYVQKCFPIMIKHKSGSVIWSLYYRIGNKFLTCL